MSDDQGDAEFEASLASLEQGRPHATGSSVGGDDTEIAALRATIEDLGGRMNAGFREDLAQIRAIASSVAERDHSADLRALRQEVAALASRDVTADVRADLATVRAELARLASAEDVAGMRTDLGPVQATLDRIATRLDDDAPRSQVLSRFQSLEARLDALASANRGAEIVERLDAVAGRLDELASAAQVSKLAGDLAAHLSDALGGLDGAAVRAELADLRERLGVEEGSVVEQLQDHLADVASGEVVGALWEEVRGVRAEIEGIGAGVAASTEPTADPAVAGLRSEVQALADEIRAVLEHAAREPSPAAPAPSEDRIGPLADELASLRSELAEGLVVEPSDALSTSLDALRAEVDSLHSALAASRADAEDADADSGEGSGAAVAEAISGELASVRTAIEELQARLDEGLVLADDAPLADAVSEAAGVEEVADQVAALRDFVASELDGLRQAVAARGDVEPEPEPRTPTEVYASVDPDTVDLLREEIRSAGGVADQVVDALREELKALRRRLAVKAAEKVLDDDQLAQIADAVAERLGRE